MNKNFFFVKTITHFKNVDFSRNCISNNIDKYVIGCFASGQKVLCSLILSDLKILSPFFVPHFSLKLLKKFEWQESIRQKNFIWHFFGEESSLLLQLTVGDSKSLELKIDGLYQMYTTHWGQGRGELGLFQTSSAKRDDSCLKIDKSSARKNLPFVTKKLFHPCHSCSGVREKTKTYSLVLGSYEWGKKYFSVYVQKLPKKAKFIAIRYFNF